MVSGKEVMVSSKDMKISSKKVMVSSKEAKLSILNDQIIPNLCNYCTVKFRY